MHKSEKRKVSGLEDRAAQISRKRNRPITSSHLATTSEKRVGSPGNSSFPHSLTFLLPISLFFLFSLFLLLLLLLLLQSLTVCLAGELHGHQWDLYMMLSFFFLVFSHSVILLFFSFFSSSFFRFPMKLARHHRGPLLRCRCCHHSCGCLASLCHAPVTLGRCATLRGGVSYWGIVFGARSSRIVSTLMLKCNLDRVTLTRFHPNPKKTWKITIVVYTHLLIHASLFCFGPSPFF